MNINSPSLLRARSFVFMLLTATAILVSGTASAQDPGRPDADTKTTQAHGSRAHKPTKRSTAAKWLIGGGAVITLAGTLLYVKADDSSSEYKDVQDKLDEAKGDALKATVTGLAMFIVGIALPKVPDNGPSKYRKHVRRHRKHASAVTVQPVVGVGTVGVHGTF